VTSKNIKFQHETRKQIPQYCTNELTDRLVNLGEIVFGVPAFYIATVYSALLRQNMQASAAGCRDQKLVPAPHRVDRVAPRRDRIDSLDAQSLQR
jgi:hypothetical protein